MSVAHPSAPPLETERLTLRGHRREDLADLTALWGDPEVTRYIGGKPNTPEEVWGKLMRMVGHWPLVGFGYWVVREKGSNRFVGEVGYADFMRDMEPSLAGLPEAGWVIAPTMHGRGLATEAMAAALGWLDATHGTAATACMIDDGNAASVRVADKLGYLPWMPGSYKGTAVQLYRRALTPPAG